MIGRSYGLKHVYEKMRRACDEVGGQSVWARSVGVSVAYVSDVMNARREPGPKILAALGLEKEEIRFREIRAKEPA